MKKLHKHNIGTGRITSNWSTGCVITFFCFSVAIILALSLKLKYSATVHNSENVFLNENS